MKKTLALFIFLFPVLCTLSAQKPRAVQIQTIDTSKYVVEYVPLPIAQKNVSAQLAQVNKQLESVEKQIAELVKKRDGLMQQKAALEMLQTQLDQAAAIPVAIETKEPAPVKPPESEKPPKKKRKPKN